MRMPARRARFFVRLAFTVVTACIAVAIVLQDHTSFLPLGLFNTGTTTLDRLADACLFLAVAALVVQTIELMSGRLARAGGAIRGAYVFIFILDLLLVFGDRLFVTGNPAGLLGQYYEVPSTGSAPVILKKDPSGAAADPCRGSSIDGGGPRILFLGDSYTEGSGRAGACNYPDVVESTLRERWNDNAGVVNAGVSGYGPVEALNLLRWYRENGCAVDAIVYNLFLENDFADNLPATERRVVAGLIFRFPRSWFLKTFHPLNTRAFRWALVLVFFARASTQDMLNAVTVGDGPCRLAAEPLHDVSPFLRVTVEKGLINAQRVAESPAGRRDGTDAMAEMRAIAASLGVPFILVVFPDRASVDAELQQAMQIEATRLEPSLANRAFVNEAIAADRVIDMSTVLTGRAGMYRAADTHLSDLGNVVAGRYVGEAVAAYLGGLGAR